MTSDEDEAKPAAPERDDRTIFRPAPRQAAAPRDDARPTDPAPAPPSGADRAQGFAPASSDMTVVSFSADRLPDDRTVFRPNPAGRRPAAPQGGVPTRPADPAPARKALTQGEALAAPNANPMMQAAAPVLLLLGRLRAAQLRAQGRNPAPQIAAAIEEAERAMLAAGVAPQEATAAKYALCASADEVLAHLPEEEIGGVRKASLATRFFGESDGAPRLYDEIARAKADPSAHYGLIELLHACLALAFATRDSEVARAELGALMDKATPPPAALSPRWRGQNLPARALRLRVPLWAAAGVAGLAVFGAYVGFRLSLGAKAEAAAVAAAGLNPVAPVAISRKEPVAPPPPPPPSPAQVSQLDHIRTVLAPNIESGALSVDAGPNQIVIRIVDRSLFPPGRATVLDDVKPLMMYVAMALDDGRGAVRVVGHSDNTPISNARFSSNFELSLERAKTVGDLLKQSLSNPERVETEGKGADAPIAPNDTAEGRAKNRRVEIVVPRSD
ncbi:type VI secretion system protein TssL, long form [Methylocella sp.]|uniref:type VI secretion system protein TssL, long form n=1 Tax=Methylocella sp. TaxID=1978226 RepID=UPI00378378C7